MDGTVVSAALRERLGPEATGGLPDLLDMARREWNENVIEVCAARFERRLVVEVAGLRLEDAAIRQQITELGATLRGEVAALGAGLRREMADGRFELLRWCFLFWVGQLVAVAGVLGLMLRIFRP